MGRVLFSEGGREGREEGSHCHESADTLRKTRSVVHPSRRKAVRAAVTDEAKSAMMAWGVSAIERTSSEKSTPPTGALKMPAMPAEAPQASIMRTVSVLTPQKRAMLLPIAAPV